MDNIIKENYLILTDLWQEFCKLHTELFEYTCEEYSLLLSSEIDPLELVLDKKEKTIEKIKMLESKRRDIINTLNSTLPHEKKIERVYDLLNLMNLYEVKNGESFLTKYNSLLIDIIEKIRQQNRRNQIFINKSLNSLKIIKDGLSGLKTFPTYNSQGLTGHLKSP